MQLLRAKRLSLVGSLFVCTLAALAVSGGATSASSQAGGVDDITVVSNRGGLELMVVASNLVLALARIGSMRHLGIVAPHFFDEALGVLSADVDLELDTSRKSGERASSATALTITEEDDDALELGRQVGRSRHVPAPAPHRREWLTAFER